MSVAIPIDPLRKRRTMMQKANVSGVHELTLADILRNHRAAQGYFVRIVSSKARFLNPAPILSVQDSVGKLSQIASVVTVVAIVAVAAVVVIVVDVVVVLYVDDVAAVAVVVVVKC
ncbi:hypothetical protein [Absidia glauca]|uniref:Uncharacterized protein n=1 Tax=Absidia glauca TaxID=4829 RepID=A0A168Q7H3_ABSGL|nr:hypothetical protein [Absidia glauca]